MATCIVVSGIGGSGTSCVAGCLHKMGAPMGKHLARHPAGFDLYEDTCLYGVFGLQERSMRAALTSYTVTHAETPVWGWKSTLAWKSFAFLGALYGSLGHELRVVVSHRTLMASVRARRDGRCPPGQTFAEDRAIAWAIKAYRGMLVAVWELRCPVLHLSYEDLLEDPKEQVRRLADFAGLDVTQEAIEHVRR